MRWCMLGFSGRIGRLPYLLGVLFLIAVSGGTVSRISTLPEDSVWLSPWLLFLLVWTVVSIWSTVALAVKRLHDINLPGPVAICLFVPAVSVIALLVLCAWPGSIGPNDYGDRPNRPKDHDLDD